MRILSAVIFLLLVIASAVFAQDAGEEGLITGRNFWEMFLKGGILMWPILLCSLVALTFVFERFISLRSSVIFPEKLLSKAKKLVGEGKIEEAIVLCDKDESAFATLLQACLSRAESSGFEMEAALEEAGERVLYDLRKNTRTLGVVADVAPLLGLMGTVVGMIKAFEVVARTGALGRTELLAQGIAEALLTTAFGLSVAVPSIVLYHFFRGKAERLLRGMEKACIDMAEDLRRRRKAG